MSESVSEGTKLSIFFDSYQLVPFIEEEISSVRHNPNLPDQNERLNFLEEIVLSRISEEMEQYGEGHKMDTPAFQRVQMKSDNKKKFRTLWKDFSTSDPTDELLFHAKLETLYTFWKNNAVPFILPRVEPKFSVVNVFKPRK